MRPTIFGCGHGGASNLVIKDGKVAGVEGHYIDGETDYTAKVN